ncbi:MAG: galE [Anaerocolumna sp.]|jgi:UDP-glucose 4-epimerase|nr:galE [Anaerocolumna sp.]
MNILITGGAGYIGSHTCIELLNNGYEVVVADNYCNSKRTVIDSIKKITGKNLKNYDCDIRNLEQLDKIFQESQIDGVIHFAALKCVPDSIENPVTYYENNVSGTINLLKTMDKYRVENLVFSSSATVYGTVNPVPYKEDMPLMATNPYGYSKIMVEQMIKDFTSAHKAGKAAILRYFNPIGAHKSGLIGENPEGIPNNLMPYICQTAAGKRPFLKVCGIDYPTKDGTGIRDYIHVCDLAMGHVKALEKLKNIEGTVIYNLGSGKGTSVYELIDAFEKTNNIKIDQKIWERRPGDTAESYADIYKAQSELNWIPQYSLAEMCLDSWHFIKSNYEMDKMQQ